jgi:hypothetical protein
VDIERLVMLPAGLSVPFDHRKDRIVRKCRRDCRGKPGYAADGDGAEDRSS